MTGTVLEPVSWHISGSPPPRAEGADLMGPSGCLPAGRLVSLLQRERFSEREYL